VEQNLLLRCSDSFDKSTGKFPQVNPQFFLDTRIGEACAKIDLEILRNAWQEFESLILLRATPGVHSELY